jgi:galactokinase
MSKEFLRNKFNEYFQSDPRYFRAPGRINLIGEHTDYNGGFVLPAGIDKYCSISIAPSSGSISTVIAADLDEKVEFDKVPTKPTTAHWMNYIWGVINALKARGLEIQPFNAVIQSEIPVGAGLSSSAALEVVFAKAFNEIHQFNLSDLELTLVAKEAENNFVGLQCGIMDMFASVHAKKDMAIKLDCRSLDFEYVTLKLQTNKILLIDTCIKHELASSAYNLRRQECESVVFKLNQKGVQATSLRDLRKEDIDAHQHLLNEHEWKRANYVIDENWRLHEFVAAISKNDWSASGKLLYSSHDGLKDRYQVSCKELDKLVEWSKSIDGIWGGRMMGGGFGGCVIFLVQEDKIPSIMDIISEKYSTTFGVEPKYYIASTGDGACEF